MLWIILGIAISYLVGSIPTAYIFGRLIKGIDIRKFGSGNVGATNALRVLGKGPGISVLALDILKGLIPVVFISSIFTPRINILSVEAVMIVFGLSCILGHIWTIFLQFKGGKGMATALGVLLGLALKVSGLELVLGIVILVWVLVFACLRIVSIASIISAVSLPLLMVIFKQSLMLVILSFALCILAIWRHKSNLIRIFQGKEKKI